MKTWNIQNHFGGGNDSSTLHRSFHSVPYISCLDSFCRLFTLASVTLCMSNYNVFPLPVSSDRAQASWRPGFHHCCYTPICPQRLDNTKPSCIILKVYLKVYSTISMLSKENCLLYHSRNIKGILFTTAFPHQLSSPMGFLHEKTAIAAKWQQQNQACQMPSSTAANS